METVTPDTSRWVVIYPVYINSKKTIAQGRRIGADRACQEPNCVEIGDCCNYLKLPCAIELDKAYPRDSTQRGRVRVQIKKEDGSFVNPAISSRKTLMLKVADLVPKHPGRRPDQAASGTSSSNASTAKSGKGGRKKK